MVTDNPIAIAIGFPRPRLAVARARATSLRPSLRRKPAAVRAFCRHWLYTTLLEPILPTPSRALLIQQNDLLGRPGGFVLNCTIRFRACSLGRASTPRPRPPPRRQSSPPKADRHAHLFRGGFLKIEWAAGLRIECMKIRKTLRAVLERSEQKSRKVYCSCKEAANGSHTRYVSRLDARIQNANPLRMPRVANSAFV